MWPALLPLDGRAIVRCVRDAQLCPPHTHTPTHTCSNHPSLEPRPFPDHDEQLVCRVLFHSSLTEGA